MRGVKEKIEQWMKDENNINLEEVWTIGKDKKITVTMCKKKK